MSGSRPLALSPAPLRRRCDAAVAFYAAAFGAAELLRNITPDGAVVFVELAVGPAKLLISEEVRELDALAPSTLGGSPLLLLLELDDVDGTAERAVRLGAEIEMPIEEQFWGERYGVLRDPFGHGWALSTRREQLDPEQVMRRTPAGIPPPPAGRSEDSR